MKFNDKNVREKPSAEVEYKIKAYLKNSDCGSVSYKMKLVIKNSVTATEPQIKDLKYEVTGCCCKETPSSCKIHFAKNVYY